MRFLGQLCLLGAFVGTGYAAVACIAGWHYGLARLRRGADLAALASVGLLSVVVGVLARALLVKDFHFAYVAAYSSRLLPWHYSLSALWVGQAGSLLLWAWFTLLLAVVFRYRPLRGVFGEPGTVTAGRQSPLREPAFGILMAFGCFLLGAMTFAADPMAASLAAPADGSGLNPLLQHPAMLIHPPIVFLGYAAWGIPFALAVSALVTGQFDGRWAREARPWALFGWTVLGGGILVGAWWAYEELGWGGYWGWDPVENGSLIPWLTGTALIHALMVWQYRDTLKTVAVALALATFAMCNFATFLTRSGLFSSLHAFSESSIGWLFLALMIGLTAGGAILLLVRRPQLAAARPMGGPLSREALVAVSVAALVILALATWLGTISTALSEAVVGRRILVGVSFYNRVLIPLGLLSLATTALAPLAQWGAPPAPAQRRMIGYSLVLGALAVAGSLAVGLRNPIALAVAGLTAAAGCALGGALLLDARRHRTGNLWLGVIQALQCQRGQYAGFLIHIGFFCLAVGVTGSSLGSRQHDVLLGEGETVTWAGRSIQLAQLVHRELPDKLVAEARLQVTRAGARPFSLAPAQYLYRRQDQWTSEVAIQSTWSGDFYTILRGGEQDGRIRLTLIENPLMRWIWIGGAIMGFAAVVRLWPARARAATSALPPEQGSESMNQRLPALCATRLSKVFGGRRVLDGVDLEVGSSECVGLTGPNGAGKTTLLRCLAGSVRPTCGEVRCCGHPVGRGLAARRLIGVVAHDSLLYPQLTLRENLIFAARMYNVGNPKSRADQLLDEAGLTARAADLPASVSRGMRQRLSVVRALVHEPRVLLLDEPFTGLDAAATQWLAGLFLRLRNQGQTILFATHDPAKLHALADRVLNLEDGQVAEQHAGAGTGRRRPAA